MRTGTTLLWILKAVGGLALLGLFYGWLGIGDQKALQLFVTALLGLTILFFTLWLESGAFVWFREPGQQSLITSYRVALHNLLPFAILCLIAGFLYWFFAWLGDMSVGPAAQLASLLSFKSRKPVKPETVLSVFTWALRLFKWVILPVLLLPLASEVSASGWRGFRGRAHLMVSRQPVFWMQCLILLLAAFFLPSRLVNWTPTLKGFSLEIVSFTLRFGLAYLLFVTAWLLLAFLSSGGKPRVTQPNTAPLP